MRVPLLVFFALIAFAAMRSFDATPLETVSETTANASIGDLNGDGHLDIVLAKGRHWPLADVVLFGDGKGHFKPGPPLPNKPDRSYSAPLPISTATARWTWRSATTRPIRRLSC